MAGTTDLIEQLDAALAGLQALRPRIEAGAPWPVSDKFDATPEAYWYPPEVLAHMAELLHRWRGVVETVAAGSPEPVEYGEPGSSPSRLAGIETLRRLPIADLCDLVETNALAMRLTLEGMPDAGLVNVGIHPTRGQSTVAEIVSKSVTGHLDEHVRQLESLLDAAGR